VHTPLETNWTVLFEKLQDAALAPASPDAETEILRLGVELRAVENGLLTQVGQSPDVLVDPPFGDGIGLLHQAVQSAPGAQRAQLIGQARDKFVEAQTRTYIRRNFLGKMLAEYRIGLCATLLGDKDAAQKAYQDAFNSAWTLVLEENYKFDMTNIKRRRASRGSFFFGGLWIWLFHKAVTSSGESRDTSVMEHVEETVSYFVRSLKKLEGPHTFVFDPVAAMRLRSIYELSPRKATFAGLF
jgi:hypothetical protein